jgi:DNA-binding response OmpR family regulator
VFCSVTTWAFPEMSRRPGRRTGSVDAGGLLLEVGGPRLRLLLALLVVDAGRVVGVPTLVQALWGWHAPPDAERTFRAYVSRLRRAGRRSCADIALSFGTALNFGVALSCGVAELSPVCRRAL